MPVLRLQKISGVYNYPETKRIDNHDGSITYFVQITSFNDKKEFFIASFKIKASEETPDIIAKNIAEITYVIMNNAERAIDKTTGLGFVKLQLDKYKDEVTFQE